jgi:dsRNA-specific ribonuclease
LPAEAFFHMLAPTMKDDERLAELMLRLDLTLSDRARAIQALTHRSHAHERASAGDPLLDNERLEFLGDAVLDLAISQRLMESGADLDEGSSRGAGQPLSTRPR